MPIISAGLNALVLKSVNKRRGGGTHPKPKTSPQPTSQCNKPVAELTSAKYSKSIGETSDVYTWFLVC